MWLVPLKIVFNFSRFKPALNLNRFFADLSHGSNSLNLDTGNFNFVTFSRLSVGLSGFLQTFCRVSVEFLQTFCRLLLDFLWDFLQSFCRLVADFMQTLCGLSVEILQTFCKVSVRVSVNFLYTFCRLSVDFLQIF